MSIEFLVTSLIVVASPGTGVLVTLAAGLSRGARAAIVAAFGCTLGIVPHMLAAVTGLAALLHTSATAFQLIKYAGVAYLLYMAWMTLKEHGPLRVEADDVPRSDRQVIVSAVLVNVLNPKLSIFFFAFLPQFVSLDEGSPVLRMVELSLVFMAYDLRGVRPLRGVRCGRAHPRHLAPAHADVDAPDVRGGLCGPRREARGGRAVETSYGLG
jgi:threonine/homoserine/homoserine lactone efflux protein